MGRETKKEKSESSSELEPALPKAAKVDQVSAVMGEVGRWQLEKILIVFLAAAPGRDWSWLGNFTSDNFPRPRSHLPCRLHHSQTEVLVCGGPG